MYKAELSELRRQIDNLDNEIIDKIFKLNQINKIFKQKKIKNCSIYSPLVTLDIARLARDKNLNEKSVSKIFKEIMELINEESNLE